MQYRHADCPRATSFSFSSEHNLLGEIVSNNFFHVCINYFSQKFVGFFIFALSEIVAVRLNFDILLCLVTSALTLERTENFIPERPFPLVFVCMSD